MRMLQWKKTFAMLLALLAITGALTGCGNSKEPDPTVTEATVPETAVVETEPEPVVTETEIVWETAPEETLGIPVENAYMTFYYPQEWEGKVEELREEADGKLTVTFQTEISGKEVVLFSVIMSPAEAEGYLLGQLQDSQAGSIYVYSVMNEFGPEGWSEEAYNEISRLQERVNDIIVQLYDDPRFVPSR